MQVVVIAREIVGHCEVGLVEVLVRVGEVWESRKGGWIEGGTTREGLTNGCVV